MGYVILYACIPSLKLSFSQLKIDGWKMILSFWVVSAYIQGRTVRFREGIFWKWILKNYTICKIISIHVLICLLDIVVFLCMYIFVYY